VIDINKLLNKGETLSAKDDDDELLVVLRVSAGDWYEQYKEEANGWGSVLAEYRILK